MQVSTDDGVYQVDNRFLGPQGITIARIGIRYQAIGVGTLLWPPIIMGLRIIGIANMPALLTSAALTVLTTLLIMRVVDHDRPLAAQLAVLAHEITAPRPPGPLGPHATFHPARIPITCARTHRRRRGER